MTSSPNDPYRPDEPLPPPPPSPGDPESAPPIYASTPAPQPTTPPAGSAHSATDTARDEASRLRDAGTGTAGHVAGTAREETRKVAGTAREQARQLADETRTQVNEQARVQRDRAAWGLRSLGDELETMARNSGQSGLATQWAHQGSELVRQGADFLDKREPGQLVGEVRSWARRRPGLFLLGAGVAGLVVGRLTRGGSDSRRDSDEGSDDAYRAGYPYDPAQDAADAPTTEYRPGSETDAGADTEPTEPGVHGSGRHTGRWT